MADLVRVRFGNIEKNVGAEYAKQLELDVLEDEPTHNEDGTVRGETRASGRANKTRTTVNEAAATKKESK